MVLSIFMSRYHARHRVCHGDNISCTAVDTAQLDSLEVELSEGKISVGVWPGMEQLTSAYRWNHGYTR